MTPSPQQALAASKQTDVTRVVIGTPGKDLTQCVTGKTLVQLIRRTEIGRGRTCLDHAGTAERLVIGDPSI